MSVTAIDRTLQRIMNEVTGQAGSNKQEQVLIEIIKDETIDNHSKAQEICDLFGIEYRYNRSDIRKILHKHEESDN